MRPLLHARARWHALQVFLLEARLNAASRSLLPTLDDDELARLAVAQRRSLEGLYRTARTLPHESPLRRAAERALLSGRMRLRADPDSETYALVSHEFEVALGALRGAVLDVRSWN